jgi:RNA polymerase sigma factor (sigma-70 family)
MTRLADVSIPDAVLDRARSGDLAAQAHLYRTYAGPVYTLIRRVIGRRAAAADLLQDTFVRVLERLDDFRGAAPLGAWIGRIAVNECLMHARSPWHRGVEWIGEIAEAASDAGAARAAPDAAIDLERLLDRLPWTARAILWLHEIEGFTHAEIAAEFNRSESFSKSQLMRAQRLLQNAVADNDSDRCYPMEKQC